MSSPYQGSCLCGAVHFEVDEIQPQMGHCHCSMCRKFHGAAFSTFGEALTQHFRWTKGEEHLKTYLANNNTQRQFCTHCGSSLRFIPSNDSGRVVEFSMGALDSSCPHQPDAHIYTQDRANWYSIKDGLPEFKGKRLKDQD